MVFSPGCHSSLPKGLRRRLGFEGIRCFLSSFHCWREGANAILHDAFLGGVLRGCVVAFAVPGIDILETGSSRLRARRQKTVVRRRFRRAATQTILVSTRRFGKVSVPGGPALASC